MSPEDAYAFIKACAISLGEAEATNGHTTIVEMLLDAGGKTETAGETPLHEAAQGGHIETVILLLDRGASVEGVGFLGWTALHYAAEYGREGVDLEWRQNTRAKIRLERRVGDQGAKSMLPDLPARC